MNGENEPAKAAEFSPERLHVAETDEGVELYNRLK